jgi:hypothetical protein
MRLWLAGCVCLVAGRAVASPAATSARRETVTAPALAAEGGAGTTVAAARPMRAGTSRVDPLAEARGLVKTLYDSAAFIQRFQQMVAGRAVRSSCVAEKLAEVKISIRIAGDEMARLHDSLARRDEGERDYALRRLRLLSERTHGLESAARVCAEDDRSSVDITQVKVEVTPQLPGGDPSQVSLGSSSMAPTEATRPR